MKRSMMGLLVLMQAMLAVVASAQSPSITITYAPPVSATPIPGSFLLLGVGLLFLLIVFRKIQRLPVGRPLAAILLLVGLSVFEVATRQQWITQASAMYCSGCVIQEQLTVSGGSTLNFNLNYGFEAQIQNTSGATEQITGLSSAPSNLFVTSNDSPQCTVGTILAPGASCYVQISVPV